MSDAGSFSCLLHPRHCFVLNYKCKMGTSQGSCSSHLPPPPHPCYHRRYLNLSPVTRKNQVVIISLQHTPSAEPFQTAMTGIKNMKKNPQGMESCTRLTHCSGLAFCDPSWCQQLHSNLSDHHLKGSARDREASASAPQKPGIMQLQGERLLYSVLTIRKYFK